MDLPPVFSNSHGTVLGQCISRCPFPGVPKPRQHFKVAAQNGMSFEWVVSALREGTRNRCGGRVATVGILAGHPQSAAPSVQGVRKLSTVLHFFSRRKKK